MRVIPDHDELRTSAEKATSTRFDDSTYPLAALRAATELGSTFSAPATLTNGSTRSPRTAHRPDAWDRPGQRRVPSRCVHAVLKPADETERGHVGQPGLHAAGRASRCWGAMSGRLRINPGALPAEHLTAAWSGDDPGPRSHHRHLRPLFAEGGTQPSS